MILPLSVLVKANRGATAISWLDGDLARTAVTVGLANGKDSMNAARHVQDTRGVHGNDPSREYALGRIPHCRLHRLVWIRRRRSLGCGGTRLGPNRLATWRIREGIQVSVGHGVVVDARGRSGRWTAASSQDAGVGRWWST